MQISDNGLTMIKHFEGLRLSAYQDSVGVWTIGYGTTQNVYPGLLISLQDASDRLRAGTANVESFVSAVVSTVINQDIFDALVSFTYNVGQGNFRKSSVLRLLNIGDLVSAADAFLLWSKAGGIMLPGLLTRRRIERGLFLRGVASVDQPDAAPPDAPAAMRHRAPMAASVPAAVEPVPVVPIPLPAPMVPPMVVPVVLKLPQAAPASPAPPAPAAPAPAK